MMAQMRQSWALRRSLERDVEATTEELRAEQEKPLWHIALDDIRCVATGKPTHACLCAHAGVVLGTGTYGEVRKALWAGTLVAAKRCFLHRPGGSSSSSSQGGPDSRSPATSGGHSHSHSSSSGSGGSGSGGWRRGLATVPARWGAEHEPPSTSSSSSSDSQSGGQPLLGSRPGTNSSDDVATQDAVRVGVAQHLVRWGEGSHSSKCCVDRP